MQIDNKKNDILVLSEGPTQGLDDSTKTAKDEYSINFKRSRKKLCLSLHYDGNNSSLFVKVIKACEFKAKF